MQRTRAQTPVWNIGFCAIWVCKSNVLQPKSPSCVPLKIPRRRQPNSALKKSSITFQKGGNTKKNGRLGPPSSAANGRPNAHRIDRSHLPGPRVHLEAPPRPDNNRVSPRVHARTPPPLHSTATAPFAPQREHTQQGASVTRGPGFRLLPAQAS